MNLTGRQLERLRILACPKSYVSSLCRTDRAAVRAAVEEIEQLRAEVARLRAALASIRERAGRNAPPSRPIMSGLETILRTIEADARAALIGGDR